MALTETGTIATALNQTVASLKAADALQFGAVAEHLFETSWLLNRRTSYRGMTKEEAQEVYKADLLKEMRERAAACTVILTDAGTVSGALQSAVNALKATDDGMPELMAQAVDLRLEAQGVA